MLSEIQPYFRMNKFKKQSGQSMIEAIVALVTILIIITAIAIVIVNGLYNSTFIKNQNEANKLSQQGMEFVRNIQKNDLQAFRQYATNPGNYCVDEVNSLLTTENCLENTVNVGSNFNRIIVFSPGISECESPNINTNATEVTVTVSWSSSKCSSNNTFCHQSKLVSCMPYIYPASNP